MKTHLIQRPRVLAGRDLHDGGEEGLGVEETGEPDDLERDEKPKLEASPRERNCEKNSFQREEHEAQENNGKAEEMTSEIETDLGDLELGGPGHELGVAV